MVKIGIVGASGYTSSELLRLLLSHPERIEIEMLTSHTYAGERVDKVIASLRGFMDLRFEEFDPDEVASRCDILFLALPHKIAMQFAPSLLERGVKVIDFSADYRLKDVKTYERWYGVEHTSPHLIEGAVYGLPELHREEIREARLVANPGCYPTGAILAAAPLMRCEGIVDRSYVIVDAKSGVSGAGRNPTDKTHYPSRTENFQPYNLMAHRHTPEMEQELSLIASEQVIVAFSPHLVPMSRGILSTLYFRMIKPISTDELLEIYREFYRSEPFVRVLDKGELPSTKAVYGSNFCDIAVVADERSNTVVVVSAIDNLVKGASGQALQNMNLMCGFDERAGLSLAPLMP
ncbi:TPA: N-acetyl-gamma-glutamyl-phosphate reductase [Candidatus Micrarchaeota archaeon]|nr:N-acetyl-gamma-glutamyl-phosphate reductase [Candidatus Micrarchaeota archaeon]